MIFLQLFWKKAPQFSLVFYDKGIFSECRNIGRKQPATSLYLLNWRLQTTPFLVITKVIESITNWNILKYLKSNNLIHDKQYGYHRERSTADFLKSVIHNWSKS